MKKILIITLFALSANVFAQTDCAKMEKLTEMIKPDAANIAQFNCEKRQIVFIFFSSPEKVQWDYDVHTTGITHVYLKKPEFVNYLIKQDASIKVYFVDDDSYVLLERTYFPRHYLSKL